MAEVAETRATTMTVRVAPAAPNGAADGVAAAAAVAALRVAVTRWKTESRASLTAVVAASFDALIAAGAGAGTVRR